MPIALPFPIGPLLRYLGVRAMPGVERVTTTQYERVVSTAGTQHLLCVNFANAAAGEVVVSVPGSQREALSHLCHRVEHLVDANVDIPLVEKTLSTDPLLGPLVRRKPGLRVPGCVDGFELAVRAVLGQQVSVARAVALATALADRFGGRHTPTSGSLTRSFPPPDVLAHAPVEVVGLPRTRGDAIRRIARESMTAALDLRPGRQGARAQLLAIRGVGPWTANYVALRALRDPDAFPSGDLGLRQMAGDGEGPVSARRLERLAAAWTPVRGYAAAYLWDRAIDEAQSAR